MLVLRTEKACACVIRDGHLLVFRHPVADVQLPKGTVDAGESPADTVMRELHEESGLRPNCVPKLVATLVFERKASGDRSDDPIEHQTWHVFAIQGDDSIPVEWDHVAVGSAVEEGLTFSYFWHPLEVSFGDTYPQSDDAFKRVAALIAEFVRSR